MVNIILDPAGGGLGNLLFQHHIAYALSKKYNSGTLDTTLDTTLYVNNGYHESARVHMSKYRQLFQHMVFINMDIDFRSGVIPSPIQRYSEPNFTFDEVVPDANARTLVIKGYFQSFKYFYQYSDEIRDLLRLNVKDVWHRVYAKYMQLFASTSKPTVCIHIRRGDYKNFPNYHPMMPESYYAAALSKLVPCKCVVFAEDVNEIKDWSVWHGQDVHFVDDEPEPLPTFFMMSMCDNFVLANSSLSLNAYLLRSKRDAQCVAPGTWFGRDGPRFDMSDIVPSNAIIINV